MGGSEKRGNVPVWNEFRNEIKERDNAQHGAESATVPICRQAVSFPGSRTRVVGASDFQALHFRLQGGALQTQPVCGAVWPREHAMGFAEDADNVLAFGVIQAVIRGRSLGRDLA